jgi:RNA polymerase sigma-70 factor (ECF subfamily)
MDVDGLVKKAKVGDKDALVQLIMSEKNAYYRLAYTYLNDKEDALDAMEDMIVILYENIHKLKKEEAFFCWSKTILVNCCKKTLRQRKKIVRLEDMDEIPYQGDIEQKDNKIVLDKYLSHLAQNHQEVIKLRYLLDLEYKDIADLLKLPIGTIKSRLHYGMSQLQEKFGGEHNG